jgi:hypothetical protein
MGHRLDAFQEFVLTFQSPWNLAGETTHRWSQSFYVSGTITHDDAAAESAGLALAQPALKLASNKTSLVQISYYPSGSLVATSVFVYAPNVHPGVGDAYSTTPAERSQLEVCAVAHCAIGKNTRGKMIYLRKYFHDVWADPTDPNALAALFNETQLLAPFNTGAGPHAVVPVSPVSGAAEFQGSNWEMEKHLFTHQLRKGKKKKKPSADGIIQMLVDAGMSAADAAAVAAKILLRFAVK